MKLYYFTEEKNMKYCNKCGHELNDEAVVCTACGCAQPGKSVQSDSGDSATGWAVLGFFIPIVGLILYLVWKDSMPNRSAAAGKGALIGFILGIIGYIILVAMLPGLLYY